eukprot:GHRR01025965.1.p1 GENE.GHRR01025965.1~~GHRR01025965.1.p1  ORF type:complete len:154 (+),score=67.31 GHRR01025965.1:696-1157(+)
MLRAAATSKTSASTATPAPAAAAAGAAVQACGLQGSSCTTSSSSGIPSKVPRRHLAAAQLLGNRLGAEGLTEPLVSSTAVPAAASSMHQFDLSPVKEVWQQRSQEQQRRHLHQQHQDGLLVPHVLISYGSGDWESHVMVMTVDEVEQMFMAGT